MGDLLPGKGWIDVGSFLLLAGVLGVLSDNEEGGLDYDCKYDEDEGQDHRVSEGPL